MAIRKSLIINSPFEVPLKHLKYRPLTKDFEELDGRRKAGYWMASPAKHNDPGVWVEIPRVDEIRKRVKDWREKQYPGTTSVTRKLLEHWFDPGARGEGNRLFFCQLEAIETMIFLAEAPDSLRTGLTIPKDGGPFERWCCKLATGTGKTIVMAMACAWQILNKVDRPQDARYSKSILIMAPGRTVRERLQVLNTTAEGNYYEAFGLIPAGLVEQLNQGKVLVRNWQAMQWDSEERLKKRRSVDKRGAKSDEAYVREVLGELEKSRNLLVINDEAHHAWRVNDGVKGLDREAVEEATKWIGALDRIHKARGILRCLDFTATPFVPMGKRSEEEQLFPWIVSDFGLNDAIESGLVKTPRVVVRDDAQLTPENKSRFYHLYADEKVKTDLNIKEEPERPLPPLVQQAFRFLSLDWKKTYDDWMAAGSKVPPVLISVCNTTFTAARVKHAFETGRVPVPELSENGHLLHIDAKVLAEAESQDIATEDTAKPESGEEAKSGDEAPVRKLSKREKAESLRTMVDTVGKEGKSGAQVRNVVSVAMLSEGWDAKTVTHIMGLRAFSSQLLCEQVVGRGLRRTNYDIDLDTGLYKPDYVNIFGVPFNFLPHEDPEGASPPTPKPSFRVMPLPERAHLALSWPNVLRLERILRPRLEVDFQAMRLLTLNAFDTPSIVELAPISDGRPDVSRIEPIKLAELAGDVRLQTVVFQAVRDVYEQMRPDWKASKPALLQQLFGLAEKFLFSDRIKIEPPLFAQDETRKRILLWCNATTIAHHLLEAIRFHNAEETTLVLDSHKPVRSSVDMAPWNTTKPCEAVQFSHVNLCVFDAGWEASEAFTLEREAREKKGRVTAWVKNDHLGFEILYQWNGAPHRYRPDYLIRLKSGINLLLEVKGRERDEDRAKRAYAEEWVKAVNAAKSFGTWRLAVSRNPADLVGLLDG